jgi:hypothetical protein
MKRIKLFNMLHNSRDMIDIFDSNCVGDAFINLGFKGVTLDTLAKDKKKDKWIVLFDYFSIGFPIILPHSVHEPS